MLQYCISGAKEFAYLLDDAVHVKDTNINTGWIQ